MPFDGALITFPLDKTSGFLKSGPWLTDRRLVIKNILAVGAITNEETNHLTLTDQWMVSQGCDLARRQGFKVSAHPQVRGYNLDNQEDFLDKNLNVRADMVVICNIFDSKKAPEDPRLMSKLVAVKPVLRQSPRHYVEGAWSEATKKTGARIVMVVGHANTSSEVGTQRFEALSFVRGESAAYCYLRMAEMEVFRIQSLIRPDTAAKLRISRVLDPV